MELLTTRYKTEDTIELPLQLKAGFYIQPFSSNSVYLAGFDQQKDLKVVVWNLESNMLTKQWTVAEGLTPCNLTIERLGSRLLLRGAHLLFNTKTEETFALSKGSLISNTCDGSFAEIRTKSEEIAIYDLFPDKLEPRILKLDRKEVTQPALTKELIVLNHTSCNQADILKREDGSLIRTVKSPGAIRLTSCGLLGCNQAPWKEVALFSSQTGERLDQDFAILEFGATNLFAWAGPGYATILDRYTSPFAYTRHLLTISAPS